MAYAASKGALNTMTLSLARALAPKIRVNAICPGFIDTRWFSSAYDAATAQKIRDSVAATTPLQVVSTAEDIADAALFLISDAARRITGEIMLTDAGRIWARCRCGGGERELRRRAAITSQLIDCAARLPHPARTTQEERSQPCRHVQPTPFLRNALLLDAAASGATALC